MICEAVIVATIAAHPPRLRVAPVARRTCLHLIHTRARRERAIVIDFRDGKRGIVTDYANDRLPLTTTSRPA